MSKTEIEPIVEFWNSIDSDERDKLNCRRSRTLALTPTTMLRDPKFTTPFTDPYEGRHDGRMSFDVVRSEWAWFHFLDNTPRSREIMLSILLYKLKNELKRIGINEYNPTAFKLAIAGCTITCPDINGLPGGTVVNSSPSKTTDRDDRRGVSSVPQLPPTTPPQPAGAQSPHGGTDKSTGGKCKGKVGKGKG